MSDFFRGYLPTKGKRPIVKFTDAMELDKVEAMDEYAGLLAEDTIVVDVDDLEQSEILFKIIEDNDIRCRVYETNRGKHFVFLNEEKRVQKCGTGLSLACGLTSDIKIGRNNSIEVLKYDGKPRDIIYDILPDEEYQEIPKWMIPLYRCKMDFLNMKAGRGRNQALFNFILTLQSNDFSVDECRQTIKIINDYVLGDKLEEKEIDTILRDDAFSKPIFFKGSTFLFDKFAYYIKNNNNVIKINGKLHIYREGVYVSGESFIEGEMIKHIPNLNRSKRTEVLSYLSILIREDVKPADARYIAFNNGVYDLVEDTIVPFSPSLVITNKIPWDYVPGAYSELCDKTLNKMSCVDSEIRALLEECVGYCFYRRSELRKFFVLTGERQNGKSTFLAMVEHLLGKDNISALDVKELSERFKTATLFGKLANIGDDIDDEFIPNTGTLKKLSSGNVMNIERKGTDPFDFSNYAKLIFSANNIPRMKDKTGAVLSRMIIVPFNARFTKDDPDFDPYIKYKLLTREVMEYLIQIGISGLRRVLDNQAFSNSTKVEEQLAEYNESNNPILLFFKDDPKIENESTAKVYRDYSAFCSINHYNPMAQVEFTKQVRRYFGYDIKKRKIECKSYRVYVKGEENEGEN